MKMNALFPMGVNVLGGQYIGITPTLIFRSEHNPCTFRRAIHSNRTE